MHTKMFAVTSSPRRGGRKRTNERFYCHEWMLRPHLTCIAVIGQIPLAYHCNTYSALSISTRFCTSNVPQNDHALSKVTCTVLHILHTYSSLPHNGGAKMILYFFRVLLHHKRGCKTHPTLFPCVLCQSQLLRKSTHSLLLPGLLSPKPGRKTHATSSWYKNCWRDTLSFHTTAVVHSNSTCFAPQDGQQNVSANLTQLEFQAHTRFPWRCGRLDIPGVLQVQTGTNS